MNKKFLKQLISASYKNENLDIIMVNKISDRLNRNDLKKYIKALKNEEKLNNVYIESPINNGKKVVDMFIDSFPDKKIKPILNTSLIAGVRINYNDDIFEISLKNNFNKILDNIKKDYD